MAKFIRLNMTDRTYRVEDVPAAYKNMGGRWLSSSIVADEVPPLCHPLGPNNKAVFAPGMITGSSAPTSGRLSVGAKSPLTGGIKESNAGTSFGQDLANMRIKAIIVEGQPKEKDKFWGIHLTWDKASEQPKMEFFDATEYAHKNL
jgi:aldehyde:ferredoxin oxidoreductase